jgi:glucose/arabinose dehydrogenase
MTERGGKISRVNPVTGVVSLVYTVPDAVPNGEGGLLGMVLHPSFGTNPYVYVTYNYNAGPAYREKVVRLTYNGTTLTSPLIIVDNIAAASIHNGSRLVIINDKLFITTGDAATQANGQNTGSLNGKVIRVNLDGTIPADNPIAGNRLWSFGHRNPQGLVYANQILYSSEHGPTTDDEVNIIEKGKNYGWPNVHGFCDGGSEISFCAANAVVEPLMAWTPTIAVCGLDFYDHSLIPQWKNSLLMTTLKDATLYQLKLDASHRVIDSTKQYFRNKYGRLRDLCISTEGKVYICTSNGGNDRIIVVGKE